MEGHIDYSFACDFSPTSPLFATGSQDMTTRIYDIRYMSSSVYCLPAVMSSIRSVKFGGDFWAIAEQADFVHIHDPLLFEQSQVVDFFGEISGISFAPNNSLYVGITDPLYGGILEMTPIDFLENEHLVY